MWTFDVNYVTRNNGYVQLLAALCVFQPLLRDLSQMSAELFVKPTSVRYFFCGAKMSLPLALQVPKPDWVVQSHNIGSCLFSRATPGNWANL